MANTSSSLSPGTVPAHCRGNNIPATFEGATAAGWTELRAHEWHGQPCEHCGHRHGVVRVSGMPPGDLVMATQFFPTVANAIESLAA